MTTTVVIVVLIALIAGYLLGKNASEEKKRSHDSPPKSDPKFAAKLGALREQWDIILGQDRDLHVDEIEKYTNFISLENAAAIASRNGRGVSFTPQDLLEGAAAREAKIEESEVLRAQLHEISALWEAEIKATKNKDGPVSIRVHELVSQYETCLLNAGEINMLRAFRRSLGRESNVVAHLITKARDAFPPHDSESRKL